MFPNKDTIILPESLIFDYWKYFEKSNIDFHIFVQNAYLIKNNILPDEIYPCYSAAKHIICISEDTINCIQTFFPEFTNKIIRVTYSINQERFKSSPKKNIITYMPRKMAAHSEFVVSILFIMLIKPQKRTTILFIYRRTCPRTSQN